jgi:hypothetical protein
MSGIIGLSSKERSGIVNESGARSTTVCLSADNSTVNTWYLGSSGSGSTLATPSGFGGDSMGSALTVSNEEITFPVTGWWKVDMQVAFQQQTHAYPRYVYIRTELYNGSSWLLTGSYAYAGNTYTGSFNSSYNAYNTGTASTVFKIPNASTYKMRLMISNPWTQIVKGGASSLFTGGVFTRIGDI